MSQRIRMNPSRSLVLAAFAGGLSLGLISPVLAMQDAEPASQAAADLPEGKVILESAIDAIGGREAFDKIEALSMLGNIDIPAMGMAMDLELHSAAEGKFIFKQIMPGMGEMSIGSDGTTGWTMNPMSGGYELIEGEDLEQGLRQANIQKLVLLLEDRYSTIETVEQADFDDEDNYKVRFANEDEEQFVYFSVDEKYIRAIQVDSPEGQTVLRFKDWETVGDVKFFKKMLISQGGMEMSMNFTEFKVNDTDAALFEQPDDVKKLVAEKEESKPASQPDS